MIDPDYDDKKTIHINSTVGKRLNKIKKTDSRSIIFQGEKIPLISKIRLGRENDNDVVINDMMVSRHHALIQKIKQDYYIKDLNSSNGTYVNEVSVPKNKYVKLERNDVIRLGRTQLTIT